MSKVRIPQSPFRPTRARRSRWVGALAMAVWCQAVPVQAGAPCWSPPVVGRVVDPFRAPACVWCPGNRGIEYEVGRPTTVRSVAAGIVEFSGVVAGERYVVVRLPNGWRLTYGRLASAGLESGQAVLAGTVVGKVDSEFLFGLRIDGEYADPAPYLGVPTGRRRLIPLDGRPARPVPAAAPRCGGGAGSR